MKGLITTALLSACLLSSNAFSADYTVGDLVIKDPYARATAPMAPVAGGFMTITNNGKEADKLIGGKVAFSQLVEVHQMSMDDGVMKMSQVDGGLEIPAGETVELKPGGYHLMFIGLMEQLKPEEQRKGTVIFEKAGELEVEYNIVDITKMMEHSSMDHDKMDHSKMDGSKMADDMKMDHSKMGSDAKEPAAAE
ncbi:copper chaperone PCu(A)C [Leucothrix mucor]|uniref:copper chaperone PCu(A)C n=1 Tax=Leucothrix mucor TaxID=45248 RepID=UPI0004264A09|nr:copper chaperone PCu(A)C [Leucothrix mucor]